MQSAGDRQIVGFLIACLICVPLLFFGWWTVCFVDVAVALVLFHVPRRFGARALNIIVFGAIFLVIMGAVIGVYERKGLVDPGPTGLEEAVLGALYGSFLITLPAAIVFGIVCIFYLYPFRSADAAEEGDAASETDLEEVDEGPQNPPLAVDPAPPGRKCTSCGTLVMGNEERCWYCGKRI